MKKTIKVIALFAALMMVVVCIAGCGKDDAKKYIIYSDNAFAPFEFIDLTTGEYTGVDMELLAAIAEDQNFEYEMHNDGFDAAQGAVQAGQADAMIAGMTIRADRQEIYDFSEGYFEDGSVLTIAASNTTIQSEADLAGKTLAAKKGTTSTTYAESIKDRYGFTINYFEDSPTMYQAVVNGNADACFEDYSVIAWAIKNDNIALKTIGEIVNPGAYGFAVKKGANAELLELFNKGLANIKANGTYEKILQKYGYSAEK